VTVHTDANAIAGLLEEIFGRDVTDAERVCQSCRSRRHVGAHRLYRSAGMVLRCPVCGDIAACIARDPDAYVLSVRGTWLFDRET
jgi:Family of unknown function (DUF6510)